LALAEDDRIKAQKLSWELFHWAPKELSEKQGKLCELRDSMAANVIMHFREFEQDYGNANKLVQIISDATKQTGVTLSDVRKWGDTIKNAFLFCNIDNASGSSLEQHVLQELTVKISSLLQDNKALLHKVEQLQTDMTTLLSKTDNNHDALLRKLDSIAAVLPAPSPPSSSRKRRGVSSEAGLVSELSPTAAAIPTNHMLPLPSPPVQPAQAAQPPLPPPQPVVPAAIGDDAVFTWYGKSAYDSTMKHLIYQVRLKGINFEAPSAASFLQVEPKIKSRLKFAHQWALTFCDQEEKRILTKPGIRRPPGHKDFEEFRSEVESAASSVMVKALAAHKQMMWEMASELQKRRGEEYWETNTYKYKPGSIKCNAIINCLEKHKGYKKRQMQGSAPTISSFFNC